MDRRAKYLVLSILLLHIKHNRDYFLFMRVLFLSARSSVDNQQRRIGMENHLSCYSWIEQPREDISFIRSQCDDVNVMRLDIMVEIGQEIIVLHNIVLDFEVGILFMEIFLDTSKFNLVPCILGVGQMNQRHRELEVLQTFDQQVECNEVALVKVGDEGKSFGFGQLFDNGPVRNTGVRALSITSAVTLPIKSMSF